MYYQKDMKSGKRCKAYLREVTILKNIRNIREFLASVSINPTISNVMESQTCVV